MLSERLAEVRRRIEAACARSGRDPASVTLVCVTKTVPASSIEEVLRLGVTDVGENRVQEAREKQPVLDEWHPHLRWHLIGSLQRNKAGQAAELFDVVHSVDSLELAEELNKHAGKLGKTIDVLVQVNVSGEASKHGCAPKAAQELANAVQKSAHLRWEGLMTIAPLADDPEAARPVFRALRELRDRLATHFRAVDPLKLSMGMSQDFDIAIEEGADLIRVGTAIFGPRA